MKLSVTTREKVTVITLEGDMVGGPDATLLSEKLRDLSEKDQNRIVVNMEKVDFMNSSGLGILIGAVTTVRNSGGDLKLLRVGRKLQELLRITKLQCVFDVFEDEDEAVASFA